MTNVLITDYKQRHSQIIIKSLENNYNIFSFVEEKNESKYFNINAIINNELNDINKIIDILLKNSIYCILPISIKDFEFYSIHKDKIKSNNIKILISDFDIWSMLNDKNKTSLFAESIGVKIPKTINLSQDNYLSLIRNNLSYKLVIKSVNEGGARFVRYANNEKEVSQIIDYFISEKEDIFESGVIAQEYIKGKSCAYFCIAKDGIIYNEFGHIRIRENPPTGGVSTSCQTFSNKKLFNYGRKIIEKSKYSGVCMVEFKYVEDKEEFYLIEVNPKFWGSILLPISAGINFPNMYMEILENKIPKKMSFENIKIQHVLSDLSRTIKYRIDFSKFILDLFNNKIVKDIFYLGVLRFIRFYIGKKIYD